MEDPCHTPSRWPAPSTCFTPERVVNDRGIEGNPPGSAVLGSAVTSMQEWSFHEWVFRSPIHPQIQSCLQEGPARAIYRFSLWLPHPLLLSLGPDHIVYLKKMSAAWKKISLLNAHNLASQDPASSLCPPSLNLSNSDILTIYDGDEVMPHILGQYLGNSGPQKLYSSTPDLTIQFHSDPAGLIFGKGQGFIMNYIGKCSSQLLSVFVFRCKPRPFPLGVSFGECCTMWVFFNILAQEIYIVFSFF